MADIRIRAVKINEYWRGVVTVYEKDMFIYSEMSKAWRTTEADALEDAADLRNDILSSKAI